MPSRFELANAIRALSMDAVQKAKSGHPGAPLGMADIAEVLWNDHLSHNPNNPNWANRDRFVLSNGHGSMLLYSLLYLAGYDLSIEDIQSFRQLHAKTAGHPEFGYAPGVETTTGPLGQGLANAVGFALAEKILAAQFNQEGFPVVDHNTYVFLGDGCLMEGVSHEVCSLAGTLGLNKLIAFYDDNGISIDGEVEGWFADDTPKRFEAYGWHVIPKVDGHNPEAISAAINAAKAVTDKPVMICCQTVIGYGSPNKAGTHGCHGAPLGDDEIAATRQQLNWPHAPFVVPEDIKAAWDNTDQGQQAESDWQSLFDEYAKVHPELAAELTRRLAGELPTNWQAAADAYVKESQANGGDVATRKASLLAINAFHKVLPELLGGSADLTDSNLTKGEHMVPVSNESAKGDYVFYGVREFGMSAIINGVMLHGGFRPFGGTFLVFMDYARNAVRMAALMKQPSIFVYTHDSIGLGEDGPTHQPVEHIASLRIIPNMSVWRPADVVETAVAWKKAIEKQDGPTCFALSRQGLPKLERSDETLSQIEKGGYILKDTDGTPDLIFIATGSEVDLAMKAADQLAEEDGTKVRVVSMPCVEVFKAQDKVYQASVLPTDISKKIAIEAGVSDYWRQFVGLEGDVIGIDTFGESAPANDVFEHFGFTVDKVVARAKAFLTT